MIYELPTVASGERAAVTRIDARRRDLRYYVAEPRRWVGSARRVLAARAIQGSNGIEGHNVSVEDAVAAIEGDDPTDARDEDWYAVTGYRRAMTYVLQLAQDEHFTYTPSLLRSLHFMMTEYALDAGPGLWRPRGIWIRDDATGAIVYEGPDHEDVPRLMDELADQLAREDDVPAMIRGALAHLNLAMIHPFRDGNGRMARCLQTLVLAREGILVPEFASIEEYLGANTQDYYDVLAHVGQGAWNPSHDARSWVRFCLKAHFVQATSVLRRVRESEQMWGEIEALLPASKLPDRAMAALYDTAVGLRVRNSGYRAVLKAWDEEISNQVATTDLGAMVRAGLLEARGKKRGAFYVAAGPLLEIQRRRVMGRQPIDTADLFDPLPDPELSFGPA